MDRRMNNSISREGVSAWLEAKGYHKLADAVMDEKRFPHIEAVSPCFLCKYSPPSSGDGKPCTVCPAEGR